MGEDPSLLRERRRIGKSAGIGQEYRNGGGDIEREGGWKLLLTAKESDNAASIFQVLEFKYQLHHFVAVILGVYMW